MMRRCALFVKRRPSNPWCTGRRPFELGSESYQVRRENRCFGQGQVATLVGDFDFEGSWREMVCGRLRPIDTKEIAIWYSPSPGRKFAVWVSGNRRRLATLHDGRVLVMSWIVGGGNISKESEKSIMEMTVNMISSRCAHIFMGDAELLMRQQGRAIVSKPLKIFVKRGCPLVAIFSSNSIDYSLGFESGKPDLRPDACGAFWYLWWNRRGKQSGAFGSWCAHYLKGDGRVLCLRYCSSTLRFNTNLIFIRILTFPVAFQMD